MNRRKSATFTPYCSVSVCFSRAIKTNPDLLPDTPWTNILYNDFWGTLLTHSGSHKSFRPLCTFSFRLNYAAGGLEPWGYHLVNVALHCCVTALFTALCHPLLGGGCWSLLAGLLFASHPIHTEAVAGLVGRADVGAGLCFLLSLLCYFRHCRLRPGHSHCVRWRTWAWLAASLVMAAVAMLWKEQGVTVLAVSAIYDICVVHRMRLRQVLLLFLKVSRVVHEMKNSAQEYLMCIDIQGFMLEASQEAPRINLYVINYTVHYRVSSLKQVMLPLLHAYCRVAQLKKVKQNIFLYCDALLLTFRNSPHNF